jgi:hypothetical protein
MTEAEWLNCIDPMLMLRGLPGNLSERKLTLTACAYCQSVWRFMGKASRKAVLLGEQMADEPVNERYRQAVVGAAIEAVCRFEESGGDFFMAADMAYRIPHRTGWYAVEWTIGNWSPLCSGGPIVRDIFGNPFHQVAVDPSWPAWGNGTVVKLAHGIYDERAFDRLSVLADALEDAGCTNADILAHCRQPGEHVRGCWVVDLVLGKS